MDSIKKLPQIGSTYIPFKAMIERSQTTPFWAAHPNFLSEGVRCGLDKEIGSDG